MTEQELVLDINIRDYVLIPIVFLMFLISLARHFINLYIDTPHKNDISSIEANQVLERSKHFRMYSSRIPTESFNKRKRYYINSKNGILIREKPKDEQDNPLDAMVANNPLMDMNIMGTMMKKNLTMVISNIIFFTWVDSYLAGFLSVKLPFGLTRGFKDMFQRGFDLQDLNVTYVSSMSWYILTLLGLGGINSLATGSGQVFDERAMMQQQFSGVDHTGSKEQLFKAEKEYVEITQHTWDLEDSEQRLLKKHGIINK